MPLLVNRQLAARKLASPQLISLPAESLLAFQPLAVHGSSFTICYLLRLHGVFARAVFGQKGLETRPDVLLALDLHRLKIVRLKLGEELDHAAAVVARAERFNLSITEEIGYLGDLFGGLESGWIIILEIFAIGTMEDIDVPKERVVPLVDDLKGLVIAGRDKGSPRFSFVEELFLCDFACFLVVRDKDDLDILIFGAKES